MNNVEILFGADEVKSFEGDKAWRIAETFGLSKRTAQRAFSLEKNSDDSLLESVEKGRLSVNLAYTKCRESGQKVINSSENRSYCN